MSKRDFFLILGTLKTGGAGLCSWRRLWATRIPSKKLSPSRALGRASPSRSGDGRGASHSWGAGGAEIQRLTPDSRAPAKQSWHHVGPMLGLCWPMLGHVGPCWAILGAMLGPCLAIYVETILRCQFFRPGPPPGVRNNVKTEVL